MKAIIHKTVLMAAIFMLAYMPKTYAHCEVPCGIFEDSIRAALIKEHLVTIEKSMKQIVALLNEEVKDYNQIVRWVNNKDEHAEKIQSIVSQYFLHQRVKPTGNADKEAYVRYQQQLEHLHHVLVYAMKCKQSTDGSNIEKARNAWAKFEQVYFVTHVHHDQRHDPTDSNHNHKH